MKSKGKRIITTLLAIMMTITILLGNGIEARAAEYSLKDKNVMGYEFESGDVIIPYDAFSWFNFTFYDGNDGRISVIIRMKCTERHTIQTSYKNEKNEIVGTGAKWKCIDQGSAHLDLIGEPYIPQTEEKKPESAPPKEVEAQPIVADQPEIAEAPEVPTCANCSCSSKTSFLPGSAFICGS